MNKVKVYPSGTKLWTTGTYGTIWHRLDGPAYEGSDGSMGWYIDGKRYTNFKEFQEAGGLTDDQMTILRLKYDNPGVWV